MVSGGRIASLVGQFADFVVFLSRNGRCLAHPGAPFPGSPWVPFQRANASTVDIGSSGNLVPEPWVPFFCAKIFFRYVAR